MLTPSILPAQPVGLTVWSRKLIRHLPFSFILRYLCSKNIFVNLINKVISIMFWIWNIWTGWPKKNIWLLFLRVCVAQIPRVNFKGRAWSRLPPCVTAHVLMSDFVYSCFYIAMLFLLVIRQSKCNLFLAWCLMASADTVREKCEERWDGTKHSTIYVWNINKTFCALSTKKSFKKYCQTNLFWTSIGRITWRLFSYLKLYVWWLIIWQTLAL